MPRDAFIPAAVGNLSAVGSGVRPFICLIFYREKTYDPLLLKVPQRVK
jgi:hypothetical protein